MAPRILWTDAESDRLRGLHAAGGTVCSIATEMGRSKNTISRHGEMLGLTWDRRRTAKAAEAVHVDNKARRARIEERLLAKAEMLLDETEQGELVFGFGGADYVYNSRHLDNMTARSKKDLIQAAASALVAANRLHEINSEGRDLPAVDAWLDAMLGEDPK